MSEPFLGEVKMMSFGFPPRGWALCNGQLLPINQNQALFALLGTTYGGNGQTTFGLPDLRTRVPIHVGAGHVLGERAGAQSVTLNVQQMPQHLHAVTGTSATGDQLVPAGNQLAVNNLFAYGAANQLVAMDTGTLTNAGGSQAHENMQPYLTISFCIALQGIFPTRN